MAIKEKKKLIQINTVSNGSIGRIMKEIQSQAENEGYETISFVGRRKTYQDYRCEKFGNPISFWSHVILNTLFDKQGHGSYFATQKLIKRLREENADIIHLHNLHGYYLHIPTLMNYLREEFTGDLYWTFHDCWPFTGHCPYFVMVNCDKWRTKCYECPNKRYYPISIGIDSSEANFIEKQEWFLALRNLKIIVPSQWMKNLVSESFFQNISVELVPNGIDLSKFKRKKSNEIYDKYSVPLNKKILLGIADVWSTRKGLNDFIELARILPEQYVIVLVGRYPWHLRKMPSNILGISYIENMAELAELYSAAFLFINPSREESFSLVTIEAMACKTPVIALDTSAVKELIAPGCGFVLHAPTAEDYLQTIKLSEHVEFDRERIRSQAEKYPLENVGKKIIQLYNG